MNDFRCLACGCAALVYPKVLQDDAAVTCSACGAFLATFGELKKRSEPTSLSKSGRIRLSGC
jgi:predicted nucleic acid-binding Zn ribbon protein